jgi:hypothetical protein
MEQEQQLARGNASPNKRRKGGKKKLKPLKKGRSFTGPAESKLLPVTDLLKKTLIKSSSVPVISQGTLLVPPSRLKVNLETVNDLGEHDSQMSPGILYVTFVNPTVYSITASRNATGRLVTNRSWGSIGSNSLDGSEYSYSTRLTQRELLHEITARAEKKREPPAFVTPIDELQPALFSWNHKLPKNVQKPRVDIIGCLQSTELILAQADQRSRHRQETMELRQQKCEEKVRQIDEAIQLKYTRAERYAAVLALKQRQAAWMKFIKLSLYLKQLAEETKHHLNTGMFFSHTIRAALVIRQACKRFMRRHLLHKFKFKFLVLFKKREFLFRLGMRIKRKEIAIQRIKTFLTEYRNHHRVRYCVVCVRVIIILPPLAALRCVAILVAFITGPHTCRV